MKNFIRCRKQVAAILVICMIITLISNQCLTVKAEEVKAEETNAIPITEANITTLSLGEQIDLSTLEKQNVSYTGSNGQMSVEFTDNHYWLKINVPEGASYILANLYDMETYCSTNVFKYNEETGTLNPPESGDGYISLKNAGNIYTLSAGLYYIWFYSETPVQTTLLLKGQDVATKITELRDEAYEVKTGDIGSGAITLEKQEGYYTYPNFSGEYTFTSTYGNLLKVTVPANTEYGLSTTDGTFYVYNEDIDKLLKLSMLDNHCGIENNTDSDAVYYVWLTMNDSVSDPEFQIHVPQKLADIKASAYEVTADDIEKGTITLEKQEGYFKYPDAMGKYTLTSAYGNLIKVKVPADTAYVFDAEQGEIEIYDESIEKAYLSVDCIANETNTEKTYYVWLKMYTYDSTPELKISTAKKIVEMKEDACEVTEEDINNGSVTITAQKGCYIRPDLDGKHTVYSKCGALIKMTVPPNTTYDLSSSDIFYVSFAGYGNDIEKLQSSGCVINNTDSAEVHYVWVNYTGSASTSYDIQFEINKASSINSIMDRAYEITDADFESGEVTLDTTEGYYSFPDADGKYESTSSKGTLVKITVPANKSYQLWSPSFKLFDSDIKRQIASTFQYDMINYTDSEAVYYAWICDPFQSAGSVSFSIGEYQKLVDIRDSAYEVSAEDIKSETITLPVQEGYYIYTDSNGTYLTSNYGNLIKVTVPANTIYNVSASTTGYFWIYDSDIERALASGVDNYSLTNNTNSEAVYYVWLRMSNNTMEPQFKIKESEVSNHLTDLINYATELTDDIYITDADAADIINIPTSVSDDGVVSYEKSSGKLYSLTLPAKNMVTITDSNATDKLYIYGDGGLDEAPVIYGDGNVTFSNLANEQKTYYLWVAGDNNEITLTKNLKSMESKEEPSGTGTKIDTTVDTTDKGSSIIVSEDKNADDTVENASVKVSVTDAADSDEAIRKGIDVITQYNSDNENETPADKIEVTYSGNEGVTVSEDTINSLKNMDSNVTLEVSRKSENNADKTLYTWTFKPDSIETVTAVNTKIDIYENAEGYGNKTTVDNLIDKTAAKCILSFEHEGVLPENTEITIDVQDQYADGTTIYYYHIDFDNNKLENIGTAVVENGCVTLRLSHCSDYVMSDKPACQHSNTEIRGQKNASCTSEGYSGDTYCKDCGKLLLAGRSIAMTAHIPGQWITDKQATVDTEGSRHTECTVCGAVVKTEKIDKLPASKPTSTTDATVSANGIYVESHTKDTIVVGLVAEASKAADLEYRWLVCDTAVDSSTWTEIQGWTKNNEWLTWKPGKTGDYVIVGQVRVVGNEESQAQSSVGIPHHAQIKGKCQMPYTGEGGGYLIGIESYDNPNQEYTYELLVLDCTLLAEGKDAWIWTTGKCNVPETSFWAVWQPQYGYYWTLFRVYDKDGNIIDQECYPFVNAY